MFLDVVLRYPNLAPTLGCIPIRVDVPPAPPFSCVPSKPLYALIVQLTDGGNGT